MNEAIPLAMELDDEARQLALLVQSVTDYAIYMLDENGYVRSWNSGGVRIKGYLQEEIIGEHFSKFYLPEDVEKGMPAAGLVVAKEQGKYEAEGWRLRKDGSRFRASVVIDPIWHEGQHVGFAKVTRDVTERYETGLRLQDAQRALVQSQKIEAIGKLTFGLAHDFNNLLTIIVNSLDLIAARNPGDARTAELVQTAMHAADRGGLLTRQLLGFARGQSLAPEHHNLNDVLRRSLELYRRACGPSVDFVFKTTSDLPDVLVDTGQFEAAILNLVTNSRDAMPNGGRITLCTEFLQRASPDEATGELRDYVGVTVSDNGPGMPTSVSDRAMEPFYTTKDVGKGSGLGLSQVFGFASQSGGFASIRSEEGLGTHVTVCLPPIRE